MSNETPRVTPRASATFDDYTNSEIRRAATTGIYDIRGGGAKRLVPHFDDLLFLGCMGIVGICRYQCSQIRFKQF